MSAEAVKHMIYNEDAELYRRQGYVVWRNVFGASEVRLLRLGCDELEKTAYEANSDFFQDACYFNLHRDSDPFASPHEQRETVRGLLRRVTYPYLVSKRLDALRWHPALIERISALLGDQVVQIVNQINFNPALRGTGWGWHQDYRFRRPGVVGLAHSFVQTLTAIDHCNVESGGLRLMPSSHLCGALQLDRDGRLSADYFDETSAVSPLLEPGDVIAFAPYTIHGSTPNVSGHSRRVYINGYAASWASKGHGQPMCNPSRQMEFELQKQLLIDASKY
jgi:ectoine hydroxylase-related dioxygenase (phytanoyl-CoA dioxygenase family)